MKVTIDVSDERVARKVREHSPDVLGLSDERAAELLAESAFFIPAEDPAGRLLGILRRG